MEVFSGPVRLKGQDLLYSIIHDVTDRKRVEEELVKTVSLLNTTLESTTDGLVVVGNDGRIASYNQKFVSIWQIPQSILATKDDEQVLAFSLNQLKNPEEFLRRVRELYSQPDAKVLMS